MCTSGHGLVSASILLARLLLLISYCRSSIAQHPGNRRGGHAHLPCLSLHTQQGVLHLLHAVPLTLAAVALAGAALTPARGAAEAALAVKLLSTLLCSLLQTDGVGKRKVEQ